MQQGVRGKDQGNDKGVRREEEWRWREKGEGKGKERSDKEKLWELEGEEKYGGRGSKRGE